jgi:hypothetical protein
MSVIKAGKFYFDYNEIVIVEVLDDGVRLYVRNMPDTQTSVFEVSAEDGAEILEFFKVRAKMFIDTDEITRNFTRMFFEKQRREIEETEEAWAREDEKKANEAKGFGV